MKFTSLSLEGLILVEPNVFPDNRGLFFELYNKNEFLKNGITADYLQDNLSVSNKNVLRGLHFQIAPYEQGKLVTVIKGAVLDVAVDIRKDSPTFGKYISVQLSEQNKNLLWIPPGFAHGFSVLEENTCFLYKCSNVYNKSCERGIRYDDADLAIDWKIEHPVLSDKDLQLMSLKEYKSSIQLEN